VEVCAALAIVYGRSRTLDGKHRTHAFGNRESEITGAAVEFEHDIGIIESGGCMQLSQHSPVPLPIDLGENVAGDFQPQAVLRKHGYLCLAPSVAPVAA